MATKAENTNQTRISEISPNIPPKSEITTFQIGLAIIPVVFVTALAFLFFKQVKYRKERYHRTATIKRLSSIPCYKCKFFDNNQQLPCAVQPSMVLTEQAFDCSDYTLNAVSRNTFG